MNNKLERIHFRATVKEKEAMIKEAEKLGMTLSEYIRMKSLNRRKTTISRRIKAVARKK